MADDSTKKSPEDSSPTACETTSEPASSGTDLSRQPPPSSQAPIVPRKPDGARRRARGNEALADTHLAPEQIDRVLDVMSQDFAVRTKEQDLRSQELQIKAKESDNQHDFAIQALDAQKTILGQDLQQKAAQSTQRFWLVLILSVLGSCVLLYCLHLGKDELVKEIVKVAASFGAGALGGYGLGVSKKGKGRAPADAAPDSH